MEKIRFWISLWGGKFFLWLFKITGNVQDDRPGMASMRLYDKFLQYVAKPKLTIVVTGTNGKTSITNMVAEILKKDGKTVAYNDWGANHYAGHARCMLDAVNIFNRPTKDAVVVESDEYLSPVNFPRLNPDYIIVSNLSRDSMLINAHPGFIYDRLKKAIDDCPNAVLILNADDPISSRLGENNKKLYFGVNDMKTDPKPTLIDDFAICPVCGMRPQYNYRNYRHIGEFFCPGCGLKTPNRDYFVTKTENRIMTVKEPNGEENEYPMISEALHYTYNTAAMIALFRELDMPKEKICEYLKTVKLAKNRETRDKIGNTELITAAAKGQNAVAVSSVFEQLSKEEGNIEIVLLIDEIFDNPLTIETSAWLHDTDYEFLNRPNIKKIISGGQRYLDQKVRMLLAGIPEEKIVCIPDMIKTVEEVEFKGIDKIYILHEVTAVSMSWRVRDGIKERYNRERGEKHEA